MDYRLVYNARVGSLTDPKQDIIDSNRKDFLDYLQNSPNKETIVVNSISHTVSILSGKQTEKKQHKTILAPYDTTDLETGVVFDWDGEQWLILEEEIKPLDSHKKFRAIMTNRDIKWINKFGETVIERGFVLGANSSGLEVMGKNIIQELNQNQAKIILPHNGRTDSLEMTDKILIRGKTWKVSGYDDITSDDLIFVLIERDREDIHTTPQLWSISPVFGNSLSMQQGEILEIELIANNGGFEIDEKVTYLSTDESVATVDDNGVITAISDGSCGVICSLTSSAGISTTINLAVEPSVTNNINYKVAGPSEIVFGYEGIYEVSKLDNGVNTGENLSIFKENDFNDDLCIITQLSPNKYEVLANENMEEGKVEFSVYEGGTKVHDFTVDIVSLWG